MKNVLFFSRSGYSRFFPRLVSGEYDSFHVVLNREEKENVQSLGGMVVGCFEEEYNNLEPAGFPSDFLSSGFFSDRFLGWLTIDERQEILGKSIAFWDHVFSQSHYSACVHETVSFESEEVLSITANKYNCRDLNFLPSLLDNYFYWKDSPYSSSLQTAYIESIDPSEKNFETARQYINKVLSTGHRPFYVQNTSPFLLRSMWSKSSHLFKTIHRQFKTKAQRKYESIFYYDRYWIDFHGDKILSDFFRKNYDTIDKFKHHRKLFFPLHYEPEAVLLYFSSIYSEQHSLIQEIAKVLPLDCVLLVKEHPQQKGMLMTRKYKELRRRNSNLVYLPGDYSSIDIFKDINAVVTIASSVGLESIVHNKPTLVLGNVFYDKHPAVYKLKYVDEITNILNKESLRRPTYDENVNFLAKYIARAKEGTLSNSAYYNDAGNIRKVVRAIEDEI